jgi:hypothetical protein
MKWKLNPFEYDSKIIFVLNIINRKNERRKMITRIFCTNYTN